MFGGRTLRAERKGVEVFVEVPGVHVASQASNAM